MGYCINSFLEDSSFEKACVDYFRETDLDSDFLGDFLLKELERICQMESPHDSDYRFRKFRKYFIRSLFNAIKGQESFEGELIQFATEEYPSWQSVIDYLYK